MENVEIPDDFSIIDTKYGKYLCHKSCILVNDKFSNGRRVLIYEKLVLDCMDKLRLMCDIYDKIEETTYFVDREFNEFSIHVYSDGEIEIYNGNKYYDFGSLDEALQYLREKYPECIKNNDIKIALKD